MTSHTSLPSPHRTHGFTLLELTVTLAIVGILATFAWGGYSSHMQKARRAEGRAALLHALLQQERHFAWQHSYHAFHPNETNTGFKWYSGEQPGRSAYHLTATACDNETLASCVRITATPTTGQESDHCGELQADSRGRRSAKGGDGCW